MNEDRQPPGGQTGPEKATPPTPPMPPIWSREYAEWLRESGGPPEAIESPRPSQDAARPQLASRQLASPRVSAPSFQARLPDPAPPVSGPPVYWEPPGRRAVGQRGIGELLSASLSLWGRGFVPLLAIGALQLVELVVFIPMAFRYGDWFSAWTRWVEDAQLAQLIGRTPPPMPSAPGDLWVAVVLAVMITMFVSMLTIVALMVAAEAVRQGRAVSTQRAVGVAISRIPAVLGLVVVMMMGIVPIALTLVVEALFGTPGLVLWLFLLVVGGGYLFTRLIPAATLLAVDDLGPVGAIGRSWSLMRGSMLFAFTFNVVAGLLGLIVGVLVVSAIGSLEPLLGGIFVSAGSYLAGLLPVPWFAVTSVVLLDELRKRSDGVSSPDRIADRGQRWGVAPEG